MLFSNIREKALNTVKVIAKVVVDNSGINIELPVLIDEHNQIVKPLFDFMLKLKNSGKSFSTINRYINATRLLLDYMAANKNIFDNPHVLFENFTSRLYTGTIGDDGLDPSELYWLPLSPAVVRSHILALTHFTDWLAEVYGVERYNPLINADNLAQRLNYAAWYRKNHYNFLGHIKDKHINSTLYQVKSVIGKKSFKTYFQDAIGFPDSHFKNFYFNGIGAAKDFRVVLRDRLILILMHGGGLRESEALHLWIEDVLIDPKNFKSVYVHIYHPEFGKAPNNWKGLNGQTTRAAYLREKFLLSPRNVLVSKKRVGWKNRLVDSKDGYLFVQWFPPIFGEIFARLWQDYVRCLIGIERNHPYAFVNFNTKNIGQAYTLNSFNYNYSKGLKRIGLVPSKDSGLSPHSHRHAYGRRLRKYGVDQLVIKKCLHHSSLESQLIYTTPTAQEVNKSLKNAFDSLNQNVDSKGREYNWDELTEYGFKDIDPEELFSGKSPKFGGHHEA